MNNEDREVFCRAASYGVAAGLEHRYEWFTNAIRGLAHGVYSDIPVQQTKIEKAFLSFEKSTASSSEEEIELQQMDIQYFYELIDQWYNCR